MEAASLELRSCFCISYLNLLHIWTKKNQIYYISYEREATAQQLGMCISSPEPALVLLWGCLIRNNVLFKCITTHNKRRVSETVMGAGSVLIAVKNSPPLNHFRNAETGSTQEIHEQDLATYHWTLSWGRSWSRLGLAGRSAAPKSWRTSARLASLWGHQLWRQTQWVSLTAYTYMWLAKQLSTYAALWYIYFTDLSVWNWVWS